MYRRILIAVDLDEPTTWRLVLPVAEQMAKCFAAELTICSVVSDAEVLASGEWLPISYHEQLRLARGKLESLSREIPKGPAVTVDVATGTICGGILEAAERQKADLIMLTSHRPALIDHLFSAHAAKVARLAKCSVLVVR